MLQHLALYDANSRREPYQYVIDRGIIDICFDHESTLTFVGIGRVADEEPLSRLGILRSRAAKHPWEVS